ncbi:hypothetical protein F2P81_017838 [Scophthalmus maximus]|uniref:Uncharacterized protein n=1 Tax=Scophthalmus maximus TaxID=52904 RepID=A0A6A4S2Z7_SCOMX|nr:hypothetical protein F2P81_017838 [Scophthalmus maximus]
MLVGGRGSETDGSGFLLLRGNVGPVLSSGRRQSRREIDLSHPIRESGSVQPLLLDRDVTSVVFVTSEVTRESKDETSQRTEENPITASVRSADGPSTV